MINDKDLRDKIVSRWVELKQARDPYLAQWLEISQQITPASGRFFEGVEGAKNEGRERWNRIYDNTAVRAANILAAGLMSGMTDPSTQWFALTTGDPDLDASHATKLYLDRVQRILEMCFTRTNTYQALHHCWREVGCYGVAAMVVLEDRDYGIHCYPLVAGEYALGTNDRGQPDKLYRKFSMTAEQLVTRFGRSNLPRNVLDCYDAHRPDKTFRCLHAIEPRLKHDPSKQDNRNLPWRSVVIVLDSGDDKESIVEDSGYNEFPAVVGRWGASASDVYSEECPGMMALGDALQLQHEQLQKGNAIDYQVNPPRILPVSARDNEIDFAPGGVTFMDLPTSSSQVQSAFNVGLNLQYLTADIAETQRRINQAFNVDMFLMISGATGTMTATEVAERHQEKLVVLGPVLSRLNNEVLKRLIERTFNILSRAGQLPPPPPELQGRQLSIEYTSMLARSQRAIRANSMDQFLTRVGNVAQFLPGVVKKINPYNIVDEYADYFSVAATTVVPTDEAIAQVEAEQQAMQQQQQAEQVNQSVDALSKLGGVPSDDSTMAGKVVQGLQGAMMG